MKVILVIERNETSHIHVRARTEKSSVFHVVLASYFDTYEDAEEYALTVMNGIDLVQGESKLVVDEEVIDHCDLNQEYDVYFNNMRNRPFDEVWEELD